MTNYVNKTIEEFCLGATIAKALSPFIPSLTEAVLIIQQQILIIKAAEKKGKDQTDTRQKPPQGRT